MACQRSVASSRFHIGGIVFASLRWGPAPSGPWPLGEIWSPTQQVGDLPLHAIAVFEVRRASAATVTSCSGRLGSLFHLLAHPRTHAKLRSVYCFYCFPPYVRSTRNALT